MNLNGIAATMSLDTIVASDTIVLFVVPLVALLTSWPVMWRKEHLWNCSVLQRVHISNPLPITLYGHETRVVIVT
jgi:hypothetical protein